jgi:membrane-bound lytic murein transglycosylase MltF
MLNPATTLAVLATLVLLSGAAIPGRTADDPSAASPAVPEPARVVALPTQRQAWTGDFDGMFERRAVRILVPYSRTHFYFDGGKSRGLTAGVVRRFEEHLNRKYGDTTGKRPITVVTIPVTRDRMLPMLQDGLGDIIAAGITVTPEREQQVDFSIAIAEGRSEIIVTGPGAPDLASIEDLAGKEVHVRAPTEEKYRSLSAYYDSLTQLNSRFSAEGKPPMRITVVPVVLEDEDLMEMVNAGLVKITVVDDWKAELWGPVLPKMRIHKNLTLRTGISIAWAFRKGSPKLAQEINAFLKEYPETYGSAEQQVKTYGTRVKELYNATETAEMQKFDKLLQYFETYGAEYGFEPLMLAAQGYQESRLDHSVKSPAGAIGVMQLLPATGAQMEVGDIGQEEANIHAGAKYMRHIFDEYFKDAQFDDENRVLFALASYNAGPSRIARLRTEAGEEGLDPDLWFNNVERIAAKRIGLETVTYVRNIYKYYVAYRLVRDAASMREAIIEDLKQ